MRPSSIPTILTIFFIIPLLSGCFRLFENRYDAESIDGGDPDPDVRNEREHSEFVDTVILDSDTVIPDSDTVIPDSDITSDRDIEIDAPHTAFDLCEGDSIDSDHDGIADDCDPCLGGVPLSCELIGVPLSPDGIPTDGELPRWEERVLLIGVNAVRSDHVGFRDTYMTFTDDSDSQVFVNNPTPAPPYRLSRLTTAGAHYHANDRANCNNPPANFATLCDGTSYASWTGPYQPITSYSAFPYGGIWKGVEHPIYMIGSFICRWASFSVLSHSNCAADSDSERARLFFNITNQQVGLGVGRNLDDSYSFWEYQFNNVVPDFASPVPSGGHFFYSGEIIFALNVETSEPPLGAYLILESNRIEMHIELGNELLGMYSVKQAPSDHCRSFYFLFIEGDGMIWRYPAQGQLRTTGENGCREEWMME